MPIFKRQRRFTSVFNGNRFFDKTFPIADFSYKKHEIFSYIDHVENFLQTLENIFKDMPNNTTTTLRLYQKRKFAFDIDICLCRIQKHIEPHCIIINFHNTLVRDSLRKQKFNFTIPEKWKPLVENHFSGIFTFTRSEDKPKRIFRLRRYGSDRLHQKILMTRAFITEKPMFLEHNIYKIEEETEKETETFF